MEHHRYTFLLLSTLLLLGQRNTLAQETRGGIRGTVLTSDGQPVEQIHVGLRGTNRGSVTNVRGEFVIERVPAGNHILVVSFVGLERQEVPVSLTAGPITELPAIVLDESIEALQEVVVTASAHSYKANFPSASLRNRSPLIEIPQNIQVVTDALLDD